MTNDDKKLRIQIADESKVWIASNAAAVAKLLGAPANIYMEILQAEIRLLEGGKQQRSAIDKLLEWLKADEVQA